MESATFVLKRMITVSEAPLYAMLGVACGLAVYTPIRHLLTAPDISLNHRNDYYADNIESNPEVLKRGLKYRGGVLGAVGTVRPAYNLLPDVGVPASYNPRHRFDAPRVIPQPE